MARPRGAMASALRRIPDFQRLDRAALAGHARLFIHPAYARLVNSEPYVKRLIPLLIILFVAALGAMRGRGALPGARRGRRRAPSSSSSLIAKAVDERPRRVARCPSRSPSRRKRCRGSSRMRCRRSPTDRGRADSWSWTRRAGSSPMAPRQAELVGRYLDEMLGPSQPLTTLGERAGVLPLTLASGEDVIATVHHNRDGVRLDRRAAADRRRFRRMAADRLARGDRLRRDQRRARHPRLRLHAQAARAQEADFIYSETQNRVPHGAPARPLGPVGMGPVARRDLLVAVDVRDPRARARRTGCCRSARSPSSSIPTTPTSSSSPTA